jgi:hypothetical protein
VKRVFSPSQFISRELLCELFISCPLGLGTKSEIYNVALRCLGHVEPSKVLIVHSNL